MKAVVQRVKYARVTVDERIVGTIKRGLLVYLAIHTDDTESHVEWMVKKLLNLRIFEDRDGKMNHSLVDTDGEILVVSQFTLYGDCRKGRRPSYSRSAEPGKAQEYYNRCIRRLKEHISSVEQGEFQARMDVLCENDGPVTLIVEKN
ncbi:MAG: D-aminoacyl-tRNA deacylase [Fibrobacterota bacterium]